MKSSPASRRPARDRLLKTYFKLSAWDGAQNVTLQKLAREGGVAFNTAHYHFHEGLLEPAFQALTDDRTRQLENKVNFFVKKGEKNALRAYVKSVFHWASENRDVASFWIFALYAASTHLPLKKSWNDHTNEERHRLKRLITESIGGEKYSRLKRIDVLAVKIQSALQSLLSLYLTEPLKSPDEHWDVCWDMIEAIMKSHSCPFASKKL